MLNFTKCWFRKFFQILIDLLDDQSISATNAKMNGMLPFAVVGSMDEVKIGNKMVRARQYPWGTVQVKSDFWKLSAKILKGRKRVPLWFQSSTRNVAPSELGGLALNDPYKTLRGTFLKNFYFFLTFKNFHIFYKSFQLYRRNKLVEMGFNDDAQSASGNFNLQEVYENKREEHLKLMQDKEDEMRQVCIASTYIF